MFRFLIMAGFAMGLAAQGPAGLWTRIRLRQAENLTRLPNYTCLETMERARRDVREKRFQLTDKARLEVALVNNNELFAWPGSKNFQDTEIRYLVPGGGVGNGSFALHARSVFLGTNAELSYQGEVDFEGRAAYRYDYDVPLIRSRFLLRNENEDEAIVAYRGSFWVERETLDLIRLTVSAYEIDPKLGIASHLDVLDYQKVAAGEQQQMLLPRQSELRMGDNAGHEFLTRITFSGCRQYSAESTISFEEKEPTAAEIAANQPLKEPIPAGLAVHVEVTSKLQWPEAAMGDPVEARVLDEVKYQKRVIIPKGSTLKGRLLVMERRSSAPAFFYVGFEFEEVLTKNGRGAFAGRLVEAYLPVGANKAPGTTRGYDSRGGSPVMGGHPSGQNLFVVYNEPRFSGGLRLVWQTLAEPLRIVPKKPAGKK